MVYIGFYVSAILKRQNGYNDIIGGGGPTKDVNLIKKTLMLLPEHSHPYAKLPN